MKEIHDEIVEKYAVTLMVFLLVEAWSVPKWPDYAYIEETVDFLVLNFLFWVVSRHYMKSVLDEIRRK